MSAFILDGTEINSHDWTQTIPAPLSQVDHDLFQSKLNDLVGFEPDGTERLKLIWMPTFERWDAYRGQWLPYRCVPVIGDSLISEGGILQPSRTFVGVPRYAFVGLVPEESRAPLEQRLVEGFDKDGTHFVPDRAVREYVLVLPILEHDPNLLPISEANKCCAEMSRQFGKKCWGKYRPPDELDITWLQGQMKLLSPMLQAKPYERSTDRDRWRITQHLLNLRKHQEAKQDEEAEYIIKSDLLGAFNNRVYSLPN